MAINTPCCSEALPKSCHQKPKKNHSNPPTYCFGTHTLNPPPRDCTQRAGQNGIFIHGCCKIEFPRDKLHPSIHWGLDPRIPGTVMDNEAWLLPRASLLGLCCERRNKNIYVQYNTILRTWFDTVLANIQDFLKALLCCVKKRLRFTFTDVITWLC